MRNRHPSLAAARWFGTAGLLALACGLALVTRADADLWGHLRFGLDMIDTGQLTSDDPYSFTQDIPWTNHEWLSELQMAWAYRTGGLVGLLLLKAAIVVSVFALAWRALAGSAIGARWVAMILLVMGTIHMTSSVRPQLWTFLCLGLLITMLPARRPVHWWLPPLFAFWVNCHGGWIVGFGVLGLWAVSASWRSRQEWRHWAGVLLASFAATLVNPYGVELWEFIATTVRPTRSIDEWQPLWTTPVLNWVPWVAAVGAIVWLARQDLRGHLPVIVVLTMLAYGAARVQRIESLFVLAAIILVAPAIRAQWPSRPVPVPPATLLAVAVVALAAALTVSAWLARQAAACVPINAQWAPDLEAMAALKHAGPGRIVTPFNWGQYAIWHLGPRLRVSLDGRRETIYSDARLREADRIYAGAPDGLAVLAEWQPEYVWLPADRGELAAWLEAHGYRIDVATSRSRVAVRRDLARLPAAPPPRSVRACFPG